MKSFKKKFIFKVIIMSVFGIAILLSGILHILDILDISRIQIFLLCILVFVHQINDILDETKKYIDEKIKYLILGDCHE